MSRRAFLRYVIGAVGSFVGIVAGVPMLGYLGSALQAKGQAQWVRLGRVEEFTDAVPRSVEFSLIRQDGWVETHESRSCWVVRDGDKLVVFNGRCPHLGCAYSWRTEGAQANRFYCPCHEGVYSLGGQVVNGPPPRPLDRLTTRVENGDLFVL
jgi:menaquinol-cytochrome c reductase iron-sulfur subunit